jgi:hypothetical protein
LHRLRRKLPPSENGFEGAGLSAPPNVLIEGHTARLKARPFKDIEEAFFRSRFQQCRRIQLVALRSTFS